MPCLGPLTAFYSKELNASGKRGLVFDKRASHSGVKIMIPCGQCVECRLDYARNWAIRLMKEKQCHDVSSFLTLTYDSEHLPEDGSLSKVAISAFCKRLHNRLLRSRGKGIRFYYCGEYGERFGRPHYHAIIFGYDFPDKKFYKYNSRGEPIYRSEFLRELWPFGLNGIGDVTFESAAYVAGYVVDKISVSSQSPEELREHYSRVSADGVYYTVLPEFSGQSRRPGIGRLWFDKFSSETYRDDSVVINGMAVRPPRYFDTLYEGIDAKRLKDLKSVRRRRALVKKADQTSRRRRVRELVIQARLGLRKKDVT